jgi:outer membrane protein assembly factor BamB
MICWDEKTRTMQEPEGYLLKPDERDLIALDTKSGKELWRVAHPVEPLTLAVDEHQVYFHNWTSIVCLDRQTGELRWRSEPIVPRKTMGLVYGPTLTVHEDVVLFADGRQRRKIWALSAQNGDLLWDAPHYPAGHAGSPEDLLVVDGLVWCGKLAGGRDSGIFTGRDPVTGEVKREFVPDVSTYWFHHRCYRAKATDKYILASRTGIEFVDVRAQTWQTHHWVRGACTYGILPCNGLIYAPPHPCACYSESKISGFTALAPASQRTFGSLQPDEPRLIRGPAFGQALDPKQPRRTDWPTYRHDPARSGAVETQVDLPLRQRWRAELGGALTAPVIVDDRVFLASQQAHQLYALDAGTGARLWERFTEGPVDSPPTVYRGLLLFGSANGWVNCLRASDGTLVWRFRAAPQDLRLMSYGRLESVWPVHGAVLVQDDVVTCVAGRSTYLDGGLRFLRLDVRTGRFLSERLLDDQQNPQQDVKVLNMPVAQSDILSSDGERLFMRSQVFGVEGERLATVDPDTEPFERATQQLGPDAHLFSPSGFLDSDAWHRSYWLYGRTFSSGCNWWFRAGRYAPAGRLLVVNGDRVYGFGREPALFVWSHVLKNHLFCSAAQADPSAIERVKEWSEQSGRDAIFNREFTRTAVLENKLAPRLHWSVSNPPLHARAMVLAGERLFVAGPPNVADEDEAFERPNHPRIQELLRSQDAAYRGEQGALLIAVSADEGTRLATRELPALPVWDGMAAAQGSLFVSSTDGSLTCLGGTRP